MNIMCDVEIERDVDPKLLRWPERGEAQNETGLGCNREYMDARGYSWQNVASVVAFEEQVVEKFVEVTDTLSWIDKLADSDEPITVYEELLGKKLEYTAMPFDLSIADMPFDIGINSAVIALSAARCIPFSSCNGGFLGGCHQEAYPLVTFYMKPDWVAPMMEAAEEAGVGLTNSHDCSAVVYSDSIWGLLRFARAIISRKAIISGLKLRTAKEGTKAADTQISGSLSLFLSSELENG